MTKVDVIIVGQGIAGSALAVELDRIGKRVLVVDDGRVGSSSIVAGGYYHPLSFRALRMAWKAKQLISFAESFYSELEILLEKNFLNRHRLTRVFSTVEEQNNWAVKSELLDYENVLIDEPPVWLECSKVNARYGSGQVKLAGRLEVVKYLDAVSNWIRNKHEMRQGRVELSDVLVDDKKVKWQDVEASYCILCNGHQFVKTQPFSYLKDNLTKGEMLEIRSEDLGVKSILNAGVTVFPTGQDLYRVSATYDPRDLSATITEKAASILMEKLLSIGEFSYEVVNQEYGIRPTIPDRKPIIGLHPSKSALGIFNGMGSKGVVIAPFFARQFVHHLYSGVPLDPEVSIARYSKWFDPEIHNN